MSDSAFAKAKKAYFETVIETDEDAQSMIEDTRTLAACMHFFLNTLHPTQMMIVLGYCMATTAKQMADCSDQSTEYYLEKLADIGRDCIKDFKNGGDE
jgi:fibrillarin-like rRNA methylase